MIALWLKSPSQGRQSKHHLYAYPVDSASGGSTVLPSPVLLMMASDLPRFAVYVSHESPPGKG